MAEEARAMRSVTSRESADEAERDLLRRLDLEDRQDRKAVGGRIFRLEDGVWVDARFVDGQEVIRVKAFSAAYFRLLQRVDEIRAVTTELGPVLVAGEDVSFQVGSDGVEELDAPTLDALVRRFRGTTNTP
jgi:hypothetical protein